MKNNKLFYSLLALLIAVSIYLIITLPQPFGYGSIGLLIISFLGVYIKKPLLSKGISILGMIASIVLLAIAFNFANYAASMRPSFQKEGKVHFTKKTLETLQENNTKQQPTLVYFYASWCAPCHFFSQTTLMDTEVADLLNDTFINSKLDAEKGYGRKMAKKYQVKYYPTVLILDTKGNLLERISAKEKNPTKEDIIALAKKFQ